MKFAEEVVVDEFLPTFRSMLAEAMLERGLTQNEVASMLGISQSAISKYAHGEIARRRVVEDDDRVRSVVDRLADGLAAGSMSRVEALGEAQALIRRLEDRDLICTIHEGTMPALDGLGCDFCIRGPDSRLRERERVLASVRHGLQILEATSGFAGLIPNVGSNLVECLPEATAIEAVAAVPGRIVDVKGRATVPGPPEFGVSEHVASVLIGARRAGVDGRAAINIRYGEDIVATLEGTSATALAQTGGFGIEPTIYLFAEDAVTAAELVRELLNNGSAIDPDRR